ncbi:MAG: DUF1254 domain-containing protein [Candidatus Kaistia colombiensis]|nr:MAG: DUF1254 domain-containing protein [Kaistia sp.]
MIKSVLASTILAFAVSLGSPASAQGLSDQDVYNIARDAYVYAYPIVTMDLSMRQSTNVPMRNTMPLRAPINQFAHARTYPRAEDRDVVRYNFDTLYSPVWLDLAAEPIDPVGSRYGPVATICCRCWTCGPTCSVSSGPARPEPRPEILRLVAPGWAGALPEGVTRIVAPTSTIWILGRTQTNGPSDYEAVHKVQDGYRLTPLSQMGQDGLPPPAAVATDPAVDDKTPPLVQVNRMDGVAVLGRLCRADGEISATRQ